MTSDNKTKYNKGSPIRCECGKVVAFRKEGQIYIKCKGCKRIVAVIRAESLR